MQIDSILIGGIAFVNQTAFVADFELNPLLNCLDLDGIIGSNIMRYCNWTIDFQNKEITLSSSVEVETHEEHITVPFHADHQYNMDIDSVLIKNLTIDYGYNGSLSLPWNIWF